MVVLMRIAWEPVQINTGYGSTGFNLEESSLTWSEQKGFGGWLGKSPINNYPPSNTLQYANKSSLRLVPQCPPALLPLRSLRRPQDPLELQQGRAQG